MGALKTREALDKIEKAGGRIVSVKPEALAVLEAISRLLANARSGDLTYRGDSVPATDGGRLASWHRCREQWMNCWMRSAATKKSARDELAGMLMDLLAKAKSSQWTEAASQLGKTAEEVEECGRRNTSLMGFAGGSKRVLFRIVERQPRPSSEIRSMVELSISDVRRALWRELPGKRPHGEGSSPLLGQMFHEMMAELLGDDKLNSGKLRWTKRRWRTARRWKNIFMRS